MITKTDITAAKVVETLTGFEEDLIAERFGGEVEDLLEDRPRAGMRALAVVVVARDLSDHPDAADVAYQHVMGMTLQQISEFFPEDKDDEGKTDAAPAAELADQKLAAEGDER